jgi:hypothetical protein
MTTYLYERCGLGKNPTKWYENYRTCKIAGRLNGGDSKISVADSTCMSAIECPGVSPDLSTKDWERCPTYAGQKVLPVYFCPTTRQCCTEWFKSGKNSGTSSSTTTCCGKLIGDGSTCGSMYNNQNFQDANGNFPYPKFETINAGVPGCPNDLFTVYGR